MVATSDLARAVKQLAPGADVRFTSICLRMSEEHFEIPYYREKYDAAGLAASNRSLDEAVDSGVQAQELSVPLEEIRAFLQGAENRCVITLLDMSSIRGTRSYTGHFVVLTGLDDVAVFHDPSRSSGPDRTLSLDAFEKARQSWGTDEDLLFVSGLSPGGEASEEGPAV